MLVIMILLGLFGCQTSETTNKDKIFISDVKRIGATLQPGQSAVVPLPLLEKNELLIAMNGGWGSIEPSAHVSKELAMRVSLALGYDEGGYYKFIIVFARDQKIISGT